MIDLLLIEDNRGDIRLMQEALEFSEPGLKIHVVEDGEDAIRFLSREGKYSDAPRPRLIFLDLNLPRKDGREVLSHIKQDDSLRRIPVIVLTTSEARQDIANAYDLHANCYIRKPSDLDRFLDVMHTCRSFWLSMVTLPAG